MGIRKQLGSMGLTTILMAIACSSALAGDRSWTWDQVSGAVNYQNVEVVVRYAPGPRAGVIPPGSKITHVYAARSYAGNAMITTSLCWNGISRCVPVNGASINTHAFDGLDASQPLYLVHRANGDKVRPLPAPVFVKGSVAVWYAQ
ncbi:hypothetical protein H0A66_05715 [Alcaligenaceae bacterium]|nr:hypothetical protein [Alcaligenaceae bacterium]